MSNRFLDALPAEVAAACLERSERRGYPIGTVLARRGDPFESVHFPFTGAVSEIEEQADGGSAEVTVVGDDALSGIEAVLGSERESRTRLIQLDTESAVLPRTEFVRLCREHEVLHALALRYAVATLRMTSLSVACNARHDAQQRLSRWLLRMHDRSGRDDFALTHEMVALMLGVRRATVTKAIHVLAAAGAIVARRGTVEIASRATLEALTCSCYREACAMIDEVYGADNNRTADSTDAGDASQASGAPARAVMRQREPADS